MGEIQAYWAGVTARMKEPEPEAVTRARAAKAAREAAQCR